MDEIEAEALFMLQLELFRTKNELQSVVIANCRKRKQLKLLQSRRLQSRCYCWWCRTKRGCRSIAEFFRFDPADKPKRGVQCEWPEGK